MQELKNIKGTHDILPTGIAKWQKIEKVLQKVFTAFCYKEIRTPVFENTALFARGVGEFSDIVSKEMYTFNDKGGESLTLRPELTAPVARSYIQHHFWQDAPVHKLWYLGPLFRQERPQAGRQRQFHQYGVEVIGSSLPEADAEVIALAYSIYRELGLKNFALHINSIGSTDTRKNYTDLLQKTLEAQRQDLCDTCKQRFDVNILRLFDCKNPGCAQIMKNHAPSILDHLSREDAEHFTRVRELLDAMMIPYEVNPALVRGLDYYTRTTFEIKGTALGAQDALCGGGRYDNLLRELDGPDTPAVGFAAGMERLILAMEAEGLFAEDEEGMDLYLAPMDSRALDTAMPLAQSLREAGYSVYVDLLGRSVKAMLREANRKKARHTAVIGEDEIKNRRLQLKSMFNNSVSTLPFEALADALINEK
ncbi:MAG: histidine--tRNA ligase [Candidatus Marinimicrobia bacterium]|jgi:histidyl-tRNA synthetase|nr:histidine--tRNA ligase [Candidatus Neomarinimicrobiota bacterium]MDD5709071.1 histidine--tRNA ligase [Candidatus Neomarinimicrobiota bacterium]MDX9778343.1 histidine--tRNA ligase [bacterium]